MGMVPVGCRAKNSARPSRSWFVFIDMVVLTFVLRASACNYMSFSFYFYSISHSYILSISIPFYTSHTFLVLQDFQPPIHIADADFVNLTANRSKCDETGCLGT